MRQDSVAFVHPGLACPRCRSLALWVAAFCLAWAPPAQARIVINEVLASNVLTNVDDEGDNSDWVELLNLGTAEIDLQGMSLTDDPAMPGQWRFPAVTLRPGARLLVWLSGKDRYLPSREAIESARGALVFRGEFIARGAQWAYTMPDGNPGPPPGWNLLGFNDSAWPRGPSGFGYGDGDDATILPAGTTAVFTRRIFSVDDPGALTNLVLQVDYDDGFVAYLNGVRVAAALAPASDPTFGSLATGSHEAGVPERFDLTSRLDLLQPGPNVLAAVGLNVNSTSSDLSLIVELGIVPAFLHANFKASAGGEYLGLYDAYGAPVDDVVLPPQTPDHSYGRHPDGAGTWKYLLVPTPEAPNATLAFDEPIASHVSTLPPPGYYGMPVAVSMDAGMPGLSDIRYTTDGAEPTAASTRYTGPVPVSTHTVFRVAGFIGTERFTRVVSRSYFIGNTLALPIISISMHPDDYALIHNTAGGRGIAWERPGYMELFAEGGDPLAAVGMGLRLHGGAGRGGDFQTKKAYRTYFRGMYGDTKLRGPVIPDTPVEVFDKLVLRSGFNDAFRTNSAAAYIRDQLVRDLHRDMGAIAAHGAWYNLYVNMQYRGIYNVVERMDYEFLGSYLPDKDWDVIKTGNSVLDGSIDAWHSARNFIVNNDMAGDMLYAQAQGMIDIACFTSYMLLNIWAQNHDWPHNNWYAARPRRSYGKWIFLSWDAEFGIGLIPRGYTSDTFAFVFTRGGYLREMFEGLLANARYREFVIHETDRYIRTALAPGNVLAHIDRLSSIIDPDVSREVAVAGGSYTQWRSNVEEMRAFARNRNTTFINQIQNSTLFAFPPVTTPWIAGVAPASLTLTADSTVTFMGVRFTPETRFSIGGVPAPIQTLESSVRAVVKVPADRRVLGTPVVHCYSGVTGYGSSPGRPLTVTAPVPHLAEIWPASGPSDGGGTVRLWGTNLHEGVEVRFGDVAAADITRPFGTDTTIDATVPPGRGSVRVSVRNTQPFLVEGSTLVQYTYDGSAFIRGDANGSGQVDIADAIAILGFLFSQDQFACLASLDANDSESVDIADTVYLLSYLFAGGPPPPPPYPDPGYDLTEGPLECP